MPLLKGHNWAGYFYFIFFFLPQGYNLSKHGRGPLGDATYQDYVSYGLRQEYFFNVSLYKGKGAKIRNRYNQVPPDPGYQ